MCCFGTITIMDGSKQQKKKTHQKRRENTFTVTLLLRRTDGKDHKAYIYIYNFFLSFNGLPVKIKNIRKRSKCGISVLRKTAGPSVSANQKAPMDDSNTHMRSHRKRPQQPKHTVNPSVCKARPLHPHRSDDHFKGGGRAVCGAVLA